MHKNTDTNISSLICGDFNLLDTLSFWAKVFNTIVFEDSKSFNFHEDKYLRKIFKEDLILFRMLYPVILSDFDFGKNEKIQKVFLRFREHCAVEDQAVSMKFNFKDMRE